MNNFRIFIHILIQITAIIQVLKSFRLIDRHLVIYQVLFQNLAIKVISF